ncbi:hypothetical protein [Nostoc sp. LPT]|nr:hypothetical protein [Nostoc sp. LPT]
MADAGDRLSYNGNLFSGDRIATGWSNYIMFGDMSLRSPLAFP